MPLLALLPRGIAEEPPRDFALETRSLNRPNEANVSRMGVGGKGNSAGERTLVGRRCYLETPPQCCHFCLYGGLVSTETCPGPRDPSARCDCAISPVKTSCDRVREAGIAVPPLSLQCGVCWLIRTQRRRGEGLEGHWVWELIRAGIQKQPLLVTGPTIHPTIPPS